MQERDTKGRFIKGMRPWNKDTKGVMKPNSGTFEKGNVPANFRGIQYHRNWGNVRSIGGQHVGNARLVWEKQRGVIKPGYVIFHKNGNHWDDGIENLEEISRGKLADRNRRKKSTKEALSLDKKDKK